MDKRRPLNHDLTMKITLIGQAPSRMSNPKSPLSGEPLASKLATMVGVDKKIYLRKFKRKNILDAWPGKNGKGDRFPAQKARSAANSMLRDLRCSSVIFIGVATARAFNFDAPPLRWREFNGGRTAVLPHPSGINRWYNDVNNKRKASKFMRAACAE